MILDKYENGMAPRKDPKKSNTSDMDEYDSEDYRKKRDRNNQAVKRSRFKSKQKTKETQERINDLKSENTALEDQVKSLTNELKLLKELFLAHAANSSSSKMENYDLEKLLADDPPLDKPKTSKSSRS